MSSTYRPSAPNTRSPSTSLPYVKGEPDEEEAYNAYLTLDNLLSYRAEHQGSLTFLCPIERDGELIYEYTIAHCAALVRAGAEFLCVAGGLFPRCRGEKGKIVGMIGVSWVDYWINKMAVTRL